jgi:hypothetical protein
MCVYNVHVCLWMYVLTWVLVYRMYECVLNPSLLLLDQANLRLTLKIGEGTTMATTLREALNDIVTSRHSRLAAGGKWIFIDLLAFYIYFIIHESMIYFVSAQMVKVPKMCYLFWCTRSEFVCIVEYHCLYQFPLQNTARIVFNGNNYLKERFKIRVLLWVLRR